MDKSKAILFLAALVFAIAAFLFYVQAQTAKAKVADATFLSGETLKLLRAQDARCRGVVATDFLAIAEECIAPLLLEEDFRRETFGQPRGGEPGYLAISNTNRRTYEAGLFEFYFDRELIQTGCHIPGTIDYGVACRFEFFEECRPGSVLEVLYPAGAEKARVFLMTC